MNRHELITPEGVHVAFEPVDAEMVIVTDGRLVTTMPTDKARAAYKRFHLAGARPPVRTVPAPTTYPPRRNTMAIDASEIKQKLDNAAANGVKAPKMRLLGMCFTRAKDHSRNPGAVYVKRGARYESPYLGKIGPDGIFVPSDKCTDDDRTRLKELTSDLVAAAKAYGISTKSCSFCGRGLTNKVSKFLSYGPVCAERFGLPHDYDETLIKEKSA